MRLRRLKSRAADDAIGSSRKTISDSPTIQRPVDAGSLHALAQSGAPTPAPNEISNVIKMEMVPTVRLSAHPDP
ncbi:hypothetical protein [Sphingopyxis sp.]|uniref:hypothetical protein n=1 Tax=Sphingopyxis sp. TaxID=1908224 RepID=UPI002615338E|nr:hypothetical protein [Sphingopyxis sp.]MCW0198600.1 hypothetical protein [Sphingopyxis sp.]